MESVTIPEQDSLPGDPTREKLKTEALRLFSERGINGVSVRDIVAAAGLRNSSSIHYYFGTKEALVKELVVDIARQTDIRRNRLLDELEAAGGPESVAQVVRVLIETSIDWLEDESIPPGMARGYMRFVMMLQLNHLRIFNEAVAVENRWNSGYLRCLEHLRRLLAEIPPEILNQRFIFMSFAVGTALSARERALESPETSSRLWGSSYALENLIDTVCGMLQQPPSADTLNELVRQSPAAAQ